jgi:hypothetical protein
VPFATKLSDITDGTPQTVLMGEVRVFPKNEGMNPTNGDRIPRNHRRQGETTSSNPSIF